MIAIRYSYGAFGPIEAGIQDRIRGFIGKLLDQELTAAPGRGRHERVPEAPKDYRRGTRDRQLTGSFGPIELSVSRARLAAQGGGTGELRSAVLRRYARMTRQIEALIAGGHLAGTNTRRVKRALGALFHGKVFSRYTIPNWKDFLMNAFFERSRSYAPRSGAGGTLLALTCARNIYAVVNRLT